MFFSKKSATYIFLSIEKSTACGPFNFPNGGFSKLYLPSVPISSDLIVYSDQMNIQPIDQISKLGLRIITL